MTDILAVCHPKGGVGRTTTATGLASSLAALGQRVLLVDLDPQGHASSALGRRKSTVPVGSAEVLFGLRAIDHVALPTAQPGLYLCPASPALVGAEVELAALPLREILLRSALDGMVDDYDVVLLDCPGPLGLITVNALVAATAVIVPQQAEYLAMEGLGELMAAVTAVRRGLNRHLAIAGVLLTMTDARSAHAADVAAEVRSVLGDDVFDAEIPRDVLLAGAPSFGTPLQLFDPTCRGARAYLDAAGELLSRLSPSAWVGPALEAS